MKFEDIDIKTITIEKSIKNSYDIKFNNKHIEFWTPELHVPFGLETKFNSYFINLEIKDTNYEQLFQHFIEQFELKLIELLEISKEELNSQLRYTDVNTIVYTKVYEKYKKIITNVKTKSNENMTIYNIDKDSYIKANLYVDKLWYINDIYYYKFKLKDIILV
jgi:hypothetical protein